jgi:hypothetical protein
MLHILYVRDIYRFINLPVKDVISNRIRSRDQLSNKEFTEGTLSTSL